MGTAEATVASCHMCGPLMVSYRDWLTASAFLFEMTEPIPNFRCSTRCKSSVDKEGRKRRTLFRPTSVGIAPSPPPRAQVRLDPRSSHQRQRCVHRPPCGAAQTRSPGKQISIVSFPKLANQSNHLRNLTISLFTNRLKCAVNVICIKMRCCLSAPIERREIAPAGYGRNGNIAWTAPLPVCDAAPPRAAVRRAPLCRPSPARRNGAWRRGRR
eukprot:SAG11_NODE_8633_length_993_cov_1.381432_1_plen_213_part_00